MGRQRQIDSAGLTKGDRLRCGSAHAWRNDSGAHRREVLRMREKHGPGIAYPVVEADFASVVCASKSGAVSLIARVITPLRYMRERDGLGTGYIPNGVVLSEHKSAARSMPAFDPGGFRFSKHKFEKCRGRSD